MSFSAWSFDHRSCGGTHTIVASQTDAFSNIGTASLTFARYHRACGCDHGGRAATIDPASRACFGGSGQRFSWDQPTTVNGSAVTVDGTGPTT
jgi:hypothetical protein